MLKQRDLKPGNHIRFYGLEAIVITNESDKFRFKWGGLHRGPYPILTFDGKIPEAEGIPLTELWLGTESWLAFFGLEEESIVTGELIKKLPDGRMVRFADYMGGYQALIDDVEPVYLLYVHEYQNWWFSITGEGLTEKILTNQNIAT